MSRRGAAMTAEQRLEIAVRKLRSIHRRARAEHERLAADGEHNGVLDLVATNDLPALIESLERPCK